jgi:excisionase family DNA binding protein
MTTTSPKERTLAQLKAEPPVWFRLGEVATWLNMSKSSVEVLVRSGELPSRKFGGARRVAYAHLRAYEQTSVVTA